MGACQRTKAQASPGRTYRVRVGNRSFEIGAERVKFIEKLGPIVPLARCGSPCLGITKVRGISVPVFNLAEPDGPPHRRSESTRIVVTKSDEGLVAFVADQVSVVRNNTPVGTHALVEMPLPPTGDPHLVEETPLQSLI